MNDPGPTSAGSINARLTLDGDEFERRMREAGEQADRLDGRNITLDVHLDGVARTAAEMQALGATTDRVQLGMDRVRLAQMRLDEVNRRANATDRQRLQAQVGLAAAQQALTTARERAAAATTVESAATDDSTRHVNAFGESQRGANTALRVFIALSPLALAGATTLAAGTVGLASGFSVMAVAGVAAIAGIKREMEAGTVTGQAYTAGLASLTGNMDMLSHTAAVSVVNSFDAAVVAVNAHMPTLNLLTGEMGSALGGIVAGTLNAFLTGLERAVPLIQAGAVQLSHFVSWLDSMAASQGFGDFINYAVTNLPAVIQLVESLVTVAGRLIAAFAPLGPIVVGSLQAVADVLNALPLPVLAALATGVLVLPAAFSLARAAVATFGQTAALQALNVTVFGTAINLAVPVVGILTAALAALTMGIAASAASQQQATVAAMDYADAVRKDGDAIRQNVRDLAAQKLAQDGAAQSAERQGVSLKLLLDATTGNSDAAKALNAQLDDMKRRIDTAQAAGQGQSRSNAQLITDYQNLKNGVEQNSSAIQTQIDQLRILGRIQAEANASVDTGGGAYARYASQLGLTSGALIAAMDAQDKQKASADATTASMQLENDAAGLLKAALDGLNGKALSAAQAQNAFDSSLANMGDHIDKTGKKITFTTTSINDMSAASVALRGQLNSQVANLQAVVEANGGLANSTGAAREQMVTMRQQIIDNAVAHGVDRDAVTAYIDKILQIPASVPPTKLDVDNANALAKVNALQAAIDALHGKTITNTVYNATVNSIQGGDFGTNATTNGNVPGAFALGGAVGYLAGGGPHPFARGTDTEPAMLTKGEFVVNRPAASTLERDHPGALAFINRHGQLPPQQQAPVTVPAFPDQVTLVVDGHSFTAYVDKRADDRISAAVRDAVGTRIGVN